MPPKADKPKVVRKPAAHPSYNEMVVTAVTNLKERSGSSRQAIVKYIGANNPGVKEGFETHVKMALKRLVVKGTLSQPKGTGASGSFKIHKVEKIVKKPVTKKPAAKKATSEKPKTVAKASTTRKAPAAKATTKPKKTAAKKATTAKPKITAKPKKAAATKATTKAKSATKGATKTTKAKPRKATGAKKTAKTPKSPKK